MQRLLHRRVDRGRLGAVGLDHHQARTFQKHLRVDLRRLRLVPYRLRACRLGRYGLGMHRLGLPCLGRRLLGLDRRRQGFLRVGLVPARQGFAPLVLAQLLLPHQEGGRGAGRTAALGRLARALVASATMAVASAAIAASAALLLFAFAAFTRLAIGSRWALLLLLMLVRRLPFRQRRRLSLLLRLALVLLRPWRPLLLVRPAATVATLLLSVAALLEARLLLAIAMLFAATVAATIAAALAPAISSAAAAVTPAVAAIATAVVLLLRPAVAARLVAPWLALRVLARLRCRRGNGRGRRLGAEQAAEKAAQESHRVRQRRGLRRRGRHRLHRLHRRLRARRLRQRCRLVGRDALDHRLLAFEFLFFGGAGSFGLFRALDQLVARRHVLHRVELVVLQALHLVVRRLEVRVGHQHDVHLEAGLELLDLGALLVQQERRHVDRHLGVHRAGVFLHRFFLHDAQHVQRGRLGAADEAGAAAARAADVRGFLERGLQALARELHQPEARDLADLHAGAVVLERVAQAVLDLALVALRFHVDEVDDDQSAQVAQPELARHLVGGLEVGAQRGLLDVAAARGTGGVDIDRDQRFRMVDHDRAARRQGDLPRVRAFD